MYTQKWNIMYMMYTQKWNIMYMSETSCIHRHTCHFYHVTQKRNIMYMMTWVKHHVDDEAKHHMHHVYTKAKHYVYTNIHVISIMYTQKRNIMYMMKRNIICIMYTQKRKIMYMMTKAKHHVHFWHWHTCHFYVSKLIHTCVTWLMYARFTVVLSCGGWLWLVGSIKL